MFLANFLIALREGLEAALVVSVIIAYLVKTDNRQLLRPLWTGVGIAIIIPLVAGAFMTWGPSTLSFQAQEIIGGVLSLVAVAAVTWMVLWMGRHSRDLVQGLKSDLADAIQRGSRSAVVWIAALAVGREGLETAVFIWGVTRSGVRTSAWVPVLGIAAGLAVAILLGWLIYRGAIAFNLTKFFTITGYFLILVAAGVLSYGIGDFQEAGVLPGWGVAAFDYTHLIDPNNILVVLAEAMFNFNLAPTWLQLIGWLAYLIIVTPLFARITRQKKATGASASSSDSTPSATAAPH